MCHRVRELPAGMTSIVCKKCGRHGRYRRETFVERCSLDMALPDALRIMIACEGWRGASGVLGCERLIRGHVAHAQRDHNGRTLWIGGSPGSNSQTSGERRVLKLYLSGENTAAARSKLATWSAH
jgi:hypothetical protein